ncbi:hypothetical protein NBEOAGPD_5374 [Methylobacterium gregans]|uniref:Uncharacterized protein n=1 Tax=Methylobacterium gregans TaxID=374424 RepID=A0AA37HU98_9HYPH|nr:hypothetical protein NBEOAGPD_5374 [Methylobacterium gregans]
MKRGPRSRLWAAGSPARSRRPCSGGPRRRPDRPAHRLPAGLLLREAGAGPSRSSAPYRLGAGGDPCLDPRRHSLDRPLRPRRRQGALRPVRPRLRRAREHDSSRDLTLRPHPADGRAADRARSAAPARPPPGWRSARGAPRDPGQRVELDPARGARHPAGSRQCLPLDHGRLRSRADRRAGHCLPGAAVQSGALRPRARLPDPVPDRRRHAGEPVPVPAPAQAPSWHSSVPLPTQPCAA